MKENVALNFERQVRQLVSIRRSLSRPIPATLSAPCLFCSPMRSLDRNRAPQVPPAGQYLDIDGNKKTWTEKEVEEAKAEVAKLEGESSPTRPAGDLLTSVGNTVNGAVAGVGDAIKRISSVGRLPVSPTKENGNGGQKDLV